MHCNVLRAAHRKLFLHIESTLEYGLHIEAAQYYRKYAHRSENAETAAYIVRNHKSLVAFLVAEALESSAGLVSHSNYTLRSLSFAVSLLNVLFDDAESDCWLCCGA